MRFAMHVCVGVLLLLAVSCAKDRPAENLAASQPTFDATAATQGSIATYPDWLDGKICWAAMYSVGWKNLHFGIVFAWNRDDDGILSMEIWNAYNLADRSPSAGMDTYRNPAKSIEEAKLRGYEKQVRGHNVTILENAPDQYLLYQSNRTGETWALYFSSDQSFSFRRRGNVAYIQMSGNGACIHN